MSETISAALVEDLDDIDLNDDQTAYILALRLDAWERARDPTWGDRDVTWEARVAGDHAGVLAEMAARATHIGMDAAIRRALGWTVEAGTLGVLEFSDNGCWFDDGSSMMGFTFTGITDPTEALAAIYAEVCP